MDENEKRRFDAIIELHNSAWRRVTERRTYEWRVAFTLWTAFAAFIAIVVTRMELINQHSVYTVLIGLGGIGVALCIIHGRWLRGLGEAVDDDRNMAIHYERILQGLSNSEFDTEFRNYLDTKLPKQSTFWGNWSRPNQLFITIVLFITSILAVLAASN